MLPGIGADTIDPNAKLSYIREFVVGVEREVLANTTVGVRYINKRIPRMLEDVANCPMVAYDLVGDVGRVRQCGIHSDESDERDADQSGAARGRAAVQQVKFDDPVHKYHAVELTLNRRMANNWSALASYRWSRLRGNFEGFYRDDNGQSDPGITSLYDFPTNDPSYTVDRRPQFGRRATSASSAPRTGFCRSIARTRENCSATTPSRLG